MITHRTIYFVYKPRGPKFQQTSFCVPGEFQRMDIGFQDLVKVRPILTLLGMALLLLWETGAPFYGYFLNRGSERLKHGFRNVALGLLNSALVAVVFAAIWAGTAAFSAENRIGFLHWFVLPTGIHFVLAILLFDLWTYAWHRLNHKIGFLWRFHRVHHSDTHMDVTSATRFHFGEIVLSSILRIPIILIIGITLPELIVYELLMILVVQFHHANIALPKSLDHVLRLVIVTPGMHKLHHSRDVLEQGSNFTAFLSIWDRLLGTYLIRQDLENVKLGVDEFTDTETLTIKDMMATPLKSNHLTGSPTGARPFMLK